MARNKTRKTGPDPCDNCDTATPALNEWGIPDWRDKAAYGDVGAWSLNRWRWEFFRRRDDVRAFFDVRAESHYQDSLEYWEIAKANPTLSAHYQTPPLKPGEPGFAVRCTIEEAETFDYSQILDPRIGEQPWHLLTPIKSDGWDKMAWVPKGRDSTGLAIQPHQVGLVFSLDKPLAAQVESAKTYLQEMQHERHGENIQTRHPKDERRNLLWLGYLRTLDARADGPEEAWPKFTDKLYEHGVIDRHKSLSGGYSAPAKQAGRTKLNSATRLCFNF